VNDIKSQIVQQIIDKWDPETPFEVFLAAAGILPANGVTPFTTDASRYLTGEEVLSRLNGYDHRTRVLA
jgi:hypothetical protein